MRYGIRSCRALNTSRRLRLNASLTRNERDNDTPRNAYPSVSTDLFVGLGVDLSEDDYRHSDRKSVV